MVKKVKKIILKGRGLTSGIAEGRAIVTKQPFNFSAAYLSNLMLGQVSPIVKDKRHELFNKSISGKVLVFPFGIGSLTAGVVLLENIKNGVAPKAIINIETEAAILAGAIFAEVFYSLHLPIVDKLDTNPLEIINTGDYVKVKADEGIVEVTKNYPEPQILHHS